MKRTRTIGVQESTTGFGEQRLGNDRLELTLLPDHGCHWTRLRVSVKGEWLDLLVPVEDGTTLRERPLGSFFLAPWSNRIAAARFEFEGKSYQLRENFPDRTAIHGDVRARPWSVASAGPSHFEATLDSRTFPDFNFPFSLCFRLRLDLCDDFLRVEASVENVDRARVPVGLGFHPYFRRRLSSRDRDVILVLAATRVYPAQGCLPTGPPVEVSGPSDLRNLRPLGAPDLDHCFTSLADRSFRLIYPGSKVEVRCRLDPPFGHVVVYAPNTPEGMPRDFVCVEPVTQANDGFNCHARGWPGTGVQVLEPGERWGTGWTISVGDI